MSLSNPGTTEAYRPLRSPSFGEAERAASQQHASPPRESILSHSPATVQSVPERNDCGTSKDPAPAASAHKSVSDKAATKKKEGRASRTSPRPQVREAGSSPPTHHRRVIPPAPTRQLFLVGNDPDDPYAAFLGAGIHSLNTNDRQRRNNAASGGRAPANTAVGDSQADGKTAPPRRGTGTAEAAGGGRGGEDTGVSFFYATPQTLPQASASRRKAGLPRRPSLAESSGVEAASPNSRSATTLPPAGSSTNVLAPSGSPVTAASGDRHRQQPQVEDRDPTASSGTHEGRSDPTQQRQIAASGNAIQEEEIADKPHIHIGLPKNFSRRFYEPIELQVESLSTFVVKTVFALWYLMFIACIVVEVIPQAQWSVVNICGRGLKTDLRRWEKWSSTCDSQTPSSASSAVTGAMDVTWTGDGLGFLNDNLKLYRRVVLSLPRDPAQTEERARYTISAQVSSAALDATGTPVPSAPADVVTYSAELTCRRDRLRCDLVRLPEEMVLMRPDEANHERVQVRLIGLPPTLAQSLGSRAAAVGVTYQKRAYTLGSLIWRYVFLLISFLHLLRFIACQRYTATLYEQSWVIILQIALFWYLDPLYACNVVTQPLPLVLAFLEFRMPTYFITVTIAFMLSVMTSSMYWKQHEAPGEKRRRRKEKQKASREPKDSKGSGNGTGAEEHHETSESSGDEEDSDASESTAALAKSQSKSFAQKLWAVFFTSPNVYDPPAWTKIITVMYVIAVFTLDIIDAAMEPEVWGPGSNSQTRFLGMFWAVIALLLLGGVVGLCLLFYVRNYLGDKPYLESRPQQLACRVFIMVFLTTIVYYIIHCFVFFFHYNQNFAATASRTPFLQLPAIMIACGFVNIMTLVYTSRNRDEGVPIHPSDQRWKFMVWPDTWYRWLARHGGSQYIFYTEEEENRFYRTQFEFRKRQFLAKLKRKHRLRSSGNGPYFGSRANSEAEDSVLENLSWLSDTYNYPGRASGPAYPSVTPISPSAEPDEPTEEPEHLSVVQEEKGVPPLGSLARTSGPEPRRRQVRSPADYQTQTGFESPRPPPDSRSQSAATATVHRSSSDCRPGFSNGVAPPDSLNQSYNQAGKPTSAGAHRYGNTDEEDEELEDFGELGRASTLRGEDLRALHMMTRVDGTRKGKKGTGGGGASAGAARAGNHAVTREDPEDELTFAKTQVFEPTKPLRSSSNFAVSRSGTFSDALFQRMYGRKIMNMDKFSTYYLPDGGTNGNTRTSGGEGRGMGMRKDNMDASDATAMHNNSVNLGTGGGGTLEPQGSAFLKVEGPAKRRSRLQQPLRETGSKARARDDLSLSSLDASTVGPRRSLSQSGHRRSRSYDDRGGADAVWRRGEARQSNPASQPLSPVMPVHARSQSASANPRGASHFTTPNDLVLNSTSRSQRLFNVYATNGNRHAASRNASLPVGGGAASELEEPDEEVPLRAYEQFVPDSVIDQGERPESKANAGSLFLRSIVRAKDRLGELVGTAERNLLERPMRNLDRLEMDFFDAAYRPFQSASYLPFFNLETALDCFNVSWEAYGVEESAGDAQVATGLKVAPENVPKAAVHGVTKVFCGCCPASESEADEYEEETEKEAQTAHPRQEGSTNPRAGTRRSTGTYVQHDNEYPSSEGLSREMRQGEEADDPHETSVPVSSSPVADARNPAEVNEDASVTISIDEPAPPRDAPGAAATTHAGASGPSDAKEKAARATDTAPAYPPPPPAAAPDSGLLPINCEKYGFELLFVTEIKEVQVLMCRMDTTAPEHKGKAPRIIIGFRGTANLSNAKYDANMHRVVWKEMEEPLPTSEGSLAEGNDDLASTLASTAHKAYLGCASCCRSIMAKTSWRPTCHAGFLAIWRAMKPHVVPKLMEVLRQDSGTVYRIFTTGHSLGGALASLCAYSVYRELLKVDYPIPDITVYTYGQPRMGNRTFKRIYDKAVPRSFRIMNESDMVVTFTMFGGYHVGIEVNVDRNGNYIVKPTDMEMMFNPTKGRGMSLLNHLMTNYGISMNAIAEKTTCPARGLGCYVTADPEKIKREAEREEAQKTAQQEL